MRRVISLLIVVGGFGIGLRANAESSTSGDPQLPPGRVLRKINIPESRVLTIGTWPSPGDYVDIQTEHQGSISPCVREAFIVEAQRMGDKPAWVAITVAVTPEDSEKLRAAQLDRGTYRLGNLGGEPVWGKILKIAKPLDCKKLPADTKSPTFEPAFPIEIDAKQLDYTPHIGAFRGSNPQVLCENCRMTVYVDRRATCEALAPGKTYFGKMHLGRFQITNVGEIE